MLCLRHRCQNVLTTVEFRADRTVSVIPRAMLAKRNAALNLLESEVTMTRLWIEETDLIEGLQSVSGSYFGILEVESTGRGGEAPESDKETRSESGCLT